MKGEGCRFSSIKGLCSSVPQELDEDFFVQGPSKETADVVKIQLVHTYQQMVVSYTGRLSRQVSQPRLILHANALGNEREKLWEACCETGRVIAKETVLFHCFLRTWGRVCYEPLWIYCWITQNWA